MILSRALDLDLTAADQATIVGRRQRWRVAAARSVREVAGDLSHAGRSGDAYGVHMVAAVLEVVEGETVAHGRSGRTSSELLAASGFCGWSRCLRCRPP